MRRIGKILSVCLCIALVATVFAVVGAFANTEANAIVLVDGAFAGRGQEFVTTVSLNDVKEIGIGEFNAVFAYDVNYVTLVNAQSETSAVEINDGSITVKYVNDQTDAPVSVDLLTITFVVDEQIEIAEYDNWFKKVSASCTSINEDDMNVDVTVEELSIRKLGDIYDDNGNGVVDTKDALAILQHVARINLISENELVCANVYEDYNEDGSPKINARDASMILQYVVGLRELDERVNLDFYDQLGRKILTKAVKVGDSVKNIPVLEAKKGRTALWSTSSEEKIVFDLENVVEGASLYPYYEKNEYSLSFNTDGGDALDSMSVSYGVKYSLPVPQKAGFEFSGWVYNGVKVAREGFWNYAENITLTATWIEKGGANTDFSYEFGYMTSGGGGYFGNAEGADLTGGKSLTMEFDLDRASFGSANYNSGIIVGDHVFSSNDPYTASARAFYWHSNWAYFDQRHCWAQSGSSVGAVEEAGAVFDRDLLFDTLNIFKAGNSIKIVYTSYTDTTGASVQVYTKDVNASADEYVLRAQVTNIPKTNAPDEKAVYIAWYVGGSPVPNYTGSFTDYKAYGSDGTEYARINVGPNMYINKVVDGAEDALTAVYDLSYVGEGSTYYAWFGSNEGVDMKDGESLTMTFEIVESSYPYANYNLGFVLNGIGSNGSSNPCTSDSESGAFFFGNPAYGASNMILKSTGAGATGAVVSGDFNPQSIMKAGNTVKVVYTYKSTGSTYEVYTRYKLDPEGYWGLACKATDLVNTPNENVHIYLYTDSTQRPASDFGAKIKNYDIRLSNGTAADKFFTSESTTLSTTVQGSMDRLMILSGYGKENAQGYALGGATWYGNIDWTNKDTMSFKVVKGDSFKIVLNDSRSDVDADTVMLSANKVEYAFYDVEFDSSYAYLYGRASENGSKVLVDKVSFNESKFSVGIRVESDTKYTNNLYLDDVVMRVAGDEFIMNFDGGMPTGTSVIGTGSAFVSDEEFTITYVTYDGEVIETQNVAYGKNATLPTGEWLNAEEATSKVSFVDNDMTVYLAKVGEELGGFYVSVFDGALQNPTVYGDTFGVYKEVTEITVIARDPAGASEIWLGWHDGEKMVSSSKEYTFTATKNITLHALFDLTYCEINVVEGTLLSGETSANFDKNSEVTVVARELDEYEEWIGWSDGEKIVSTDTTYTFVADRNVTLTATFRAKTFKVVVVNGFIRGENVSEMEVLGGTKITVAANSSGGTCKGWQVGGVTVSTRTRYTFTVTEDITLTPIFA